MAKKIPARKEQQWKRLRTNQRGKYLAGKRRAGNVPVTEMAGLPAL